MTVWIVTLRGQQLNPSCRGFVSIAISQNLISLRIEGFITRLTWLTYDESRGTVPRGYLDCDSIIVSLIF